MKLFLSTSFSHKINDSTGEVEQEFRREIEQILATLRTAGHEVFAAAEDEGWRVNDGDPTKAARYDIQHIDEADALVAILHAKISAGVQWEIGYANALGKKVYIISDKAADVGYWNRALEELGRVTRLPYSQQSIQEFADAIKDIQRR